MVQSTTKRELFIVPVVAFERKKFSTLAPSGGVTLSVLIPAQGPYKVVLEEV